MEAMELGRIEVWNDKSNVIQLGELGLTELFNEFYFQTCQISLKSIKTFKFALCLDPYLVVRICREYDQSVQPEKLIKIKYESEI